MPYSLLGMTDGIDISVKYFALYFRSQLRTENRNNELSHVSTCAVRFR